MSAPDSRKPFLTARWMNLLVFTFKVPDAAVQAHLPPGTEPDRWEGSALASIVAFDFLDTRVMGAAIPGFRNFPEWNLRVYAKRDEERGVVFVREFVPNPVVAGIARRVYNEPYSVARFKSERSREGGTQSILHHVRAAGTVSSAGVRASTEAKPPPRLGPEPFIKEQGWGYGQTRGGQTLRYRVTHPEWRAFPVESWTLSVDYERLYGAHWAFLKDAQPFNVMLAEGSAVAVYPGELI